MEILFWILYFLSGLNVCFSILQEPQKFDNRIQAIILIVGFIVLWPLIAVWNIIDFLFQKV